MIFSVYTNGRSLLSAKKSKSKDVMDCVHGIRVFSTQWVVLGHSYTAMYTAMPITNAFSFIGNVSDFSSSEVLTIRRGTTISLYRFAAHDTISQHVSAVSIHFC